jgi:hypothetical protein
MLSRFAVLVTLCVWLSGAPVAEAEERPCRFLCAPSFNIEPTVTVEPLFKGARVAEDGGEPVRPPRETVFETVFALDIPTRVPRLGFTLKAIVAPFGRTGENPRW